VIERAASGDPHAARELVARHHGRMYALALRAIGDAAEAEDLVQDAFVRAFRGLHRFDSRFRLSTWLNRIVLNSCRDHLKSAQRREQPYGEQLDAAPGEAELDGDPMVSDQRARRLHHALAELRPNYREIVLLKDMMGFSFEEIRGVTGAPITGLKIRAIRARARLRKLLEKTV
jgi:RNA polymerase sigma-70 factor (ECF subfamily)